MILSKGIIIIYLFAGLLKCPSLFAFIAVSMNTFTKNAFSEKQILEFIYLFIRHTLRATMDQVH